MIDSLFSVLASALSIWDHAEKDKYISQCISLKEKYYAEIAKPDDSRSDAIIDYCLSELCFIGAAYSAAVSSKNAGTTAGQTGS